MTLIKTMETTTATYYTPELEEFHIGFEYEQNEDYDVLPEKKWHKQTFHPSNFNPESPYFISQNSIYAETIRVKYLDREDIEILGFSEDKEYRERPRQISYKPINFRKGAYIINFWITRFEDNPEHKIEIKIQNFILFYGICKNKSKLKSLLKDVGAL